VGSYTFPKVVPPKGGPPRGLPKWGLPRGVLQTWSSVFPMWVLQGGSVRRSSKLSPKGVPGLVSAKLCSPAGVLQVGSRREVRQAWSPNGVPQCCSLKRFNKYLPERDAPEGVPLTGITRGFLTGCSLVSPEQFPGRGSYVRFPSCFPTSFPVEFHEGFPRNAVPIGVHRVDSTWGLHKGKYRAKFSLWGLKRCYPRGIPEVCFRSRSAVGILSCCFHTGSQVGESRCCPRFGFPSVSHCWVCISWLKCWFPECLYFFPMDSNEGFSLAVAHSLSDKSASEQPLEIPQHPRVHEG
jgi:hypothetical protein